MLDKLDHRRGSTNETGSKATVGPRQAVATDG
jgi:hypothetical protein